MVTTCAALPLVPSALLVDRQFGGRPGLETRVRNSEPALGRYAIGSSGQTLLGSFEGVELPKQIVGESFVKLFLVQICSQVRRVEERVRLFAIVLTRVLSQCALESPPLGREELASALDAHQRTPSMYSACHTAESSTGSTSAWHTSARCRVA